MNNTDLPHDTLDRLLTFVQDELQLSASPALTWYHDGENWTWDSGTCARLKHCVYWFVSGGVVLYVGKATDLDSRMRTHWDNMNRYKTDQMVDGVVKVANQNGDLVVWAAEVPFADVGGYKVPQEDLIETAMIWHVDPPVNRAKRK